MSKITSILFFALLAPILSLAQEEKVQPPIASRLLGIWAMDFEKTLKASIARAEKEEGRKLDPAERKDIQEEVEYARKILLHFKADGIVMTHRPGEIEAVKYKIKRPNNKSGRFILKVSYDDEFDDQAKCLLEKDSLFLSMEEEEMDVSLTRISEADSKGRIAELKKMKPADE